jgi:hypothetical protein
MNVSYIPSHRLRSTHLDIDEKGVPRVAAVDSLSDILASLGCFSNGDLFYVVLLKEMDKLGNRMVKVNKAGRIWVLSGEQERPLYSKSKG